MNELINQLTEYFQNGSSTVKKYLHSFVVVEFGVVLGRGATLGGEEAEGVPGKEIK